MHAFQPLAPGLPLPDGLMNTGALVVGMGVMPQRLLLTKATWYSPEHHPPAAESNTVPP